MSVSQERSKALAAPFPLEAHGFRVLRKSKNNSALVSIYINARDVMQRLDEVVGTFGWSDHYSVHFIERGLDARGNPSVDAAVACDLIVHEEIEGGITLHIAKQDVGTGTGPDGLKSAYSDALKRTAVKFGIGRYLYDHKDETWYPIDDWGNLTPDSLNRAKVAFAKYLASLGIQVQEQRDVEFAAAGRSGQKAAAKAEPVRETIQDYQQDDNGHWEDTPEDDDNPWDSDDLGFSQETAEFVDWCQKQSTMDTRTPSIKQIELVRKVIDKITGTEGSAAVVLDILCTTPAYSNVVVKELLDTLLEQTRDQKTGEYVANSKFKPGRIAAVKEIYEVIGD